MNKNDAHTTLQELKEMVDKFGKDRHWQHHHTSKNLSMGIVIEAAELMEHFQWERDGEPDAEAIADELSDVIFNCLNFALINNIDVATAFHNKYQKLVKKYPAAIFNKNNDSRKDYDRIKKAYRAEQ